MRRREILKAMVLAPTLLVSWSTVAQIPGLRVPGLGGGQDNAGTDWDSIVSEYSTLVVKFSSETSTMGNVSAHIAEILQIQQEAGLLRAEADRLATSGDGVSADQFDTFSAVSDSTNTLIQEKLASADALSDDQIRALAEVSLEYISTLLSGAQTARDLRTTLQKISSAGTPGLLQAASAVEVVRTAPVMIPKFITFTGSSLNNGRSILMALNSKGVATPDTSELASAFSDFA